MGKLNGIIPVITTPYEEDGALDYDSLIREVEVIKQMGCDGCTLFSVAGEYFKQSDAEQKKMLDLVSSKCQELKLPLVASSTQRSTYCAVERAKMYEDAGVDCIMVLPPQGIQGQELIDHIGNMADAVKIPLMIQYCPSHTGSPIPVESFQKMPEEHKNIEYFKIESVPSGPFTTALIEKLGEGATVIAGYAGLTLIEMYDRGAVGVMPAAALSEVYMALHNAYFSGDRDEALRIHNSLVPLLNHLIQYPPALHYYEKDFLVRRGIIKAANVRRPDYRHDKYMDDLANKYYELVESYLPYYG